MLFRLTQKLATKIKIGKRIEMPLEQNAFADWSGHIFVANRQQYILMSNTQSLYSCIMPGKGITNESKFVDAAIQRIEQSMDEDGLGKLFEKYVLPASQKFHFGKALNRSVTGSMNDHIIGAKIYFEDKDLNEVGRCLNQTPLSALRDEEGRKYNSPDRAIKLLLKDATTE